MLRSVIVDIKVRYIIDKDKSFKILVIFNILNLLLIKFIYIFDYVMIEGGVLVY